MILVASSMKVINFKESVGKQSISFSTISNSPSENLPNKFIICSSHLLEKISLSTGLYQIYGNDTQPWLSLSFWDYDENYSFWVYISGLWFSVGKNISGLLHHWYHICIQIDAFSGKMTSAFNGKKNNDIEKIENALRMLNFITHNKCHKTP